MTLSRWKMLAGVLGISLGGLAAVAAQCPKTDASKGGKSADTPMMPEAPAAAAKAPPAPVAPPAPLIPAPLPDLPVLPQVKLPEVKLPEAPSVIPASGQEPKPPLPMTDPAPKPAPTVLPTPAAVDKNPTAPALGLPDPKPSLPGSGPPTGFDPGVRPSLPPAPQLPTEGSPRLPPPPPDVDTSSKQPVPGGTSPLGKAAPPNYPTQNIDPLIGTAPAVGPTPAAPAVASKFRILLRVGEGEPTFEVHCGDDLVLKVICEKVDIKSPEKGNGPSAVKASGKVRFAGFGAEGICDELSFFAGNGEVSMTGAVKIHVKDKLGRVESELSTDSIRYKLDPCPTGFTKP